jgi:hypothetical protein
MCRGFFLSEHRAHWQVDRPASAGAPPSPLVSPSVRLVEVHPRRRWGAEALAAPWRVAGRGFFFSEHRELSEVTRPASEERSVAYPRWLGPAYRGSPPCTDAEAEEALVAQRRGFLFAQEAACLLTLRWRGQFTRPLKAHRFTINRDIAKRNSILTSIAPTKSRGGWTSMEFRSAG